MIMSNTIPDVRTGEQVYINDCSGGMLAIGNYVVKYSDLLPIIAHYAKGALFGFNTKKHGMASIGSIPPKELDAVREFFDELSDLVEVTDKITGNTRFVKESEMAKIQTFVKPKFDPGSDFILKYLRGKEWTSPTEIGKAYRKGLHSAWASPRCRKLVEKGLLERNAKGWYKLR